ncbi:MAG: DEAD/DEAH box helicase [Alphaproteobacteria bacterium]|nr:DEAD/DEAH box helicase [Alphaproteobacteria bacterium]
MQLRRWQQSVIDDFLSIRDSYKRFILKAPTGAGKTVLAREIIDRFYEGKKVVVLCHRLILLDQLQRALNKGRRVKTLKISDKGEAFKDYDILLSTSMRARDVLEDAIPKADLIIVDEAHRVSPNGRGYRRIIDLFRDQGKRGAHFMGLTASPERRTGDQRDQLSLAFDAIIDCADIQDLIEEGILVRPRYRPHFIHDLNLDGIDVSSGEFPVARLTDEIIKSSMLDSAVRAYLDERTKVLPIPISAWFCPDIRVAEVTEERLKQTGIRSATITAGTPMRERRRILAAHEKGEIEALVSVGVLIEGWDNPDCNIIVHMRPTLSKVLWGQSIGRGLRSSPKKTECVVIDVSSNWTTFGPVEKLKWTLWSPPRSFLQFQNRFNWIGQQQDDETNPETYLLCKNEIEPGVACSHIYRKDSFDGDTCPACNKYAAVDIYKAQKLNLTINDNKLHNIFFSRVPEIYESLNISVWESLEDNAWRTANDKEIVYLLFCLAFVKSSSHVAVDEGQYWEDTLKTEAEIRRELIDERRYVAKKMEFDLSWLADGLDSRREVRTLQANFGVSITGPVLNALSRPECEAKYQRAIKITERIVTLGCSPKDDLPYFVA